MQRLRKKRDESGSNSIQRENVPGLRGGRVSWARRGIAALGVVFLLLWMCCNDLLILCNIMMKRMENVLSRCIYSLQDETNASFKQAEHIIPKAIGGMYTLPKGMVSDAVNHEFSEFEEHVIHNYPMIVLPRSFFGPRGRRKHTKRGNVTLMTGPDTDQPELGYMVEGKPYPIHQVIASLDAEGNIIGKFGVILPENAGYTDDSSANIKRFAQNILSLPRYFRIIRMDNEAILNRLIVGYEKDQLYLGVHSSLAKEDVISKGKMLLNFLERILHDDLQPKHHGECVHSKHQVTAYKTYSFSFPSVYRFCAKIAFNALARVLADDRIYHAKYDAIRHAISTGENIENFVQLILAEDHKKQIPAIVTWLNLGQHCHHVLFSRIENRLVASVSFYGGALMANVSIGEITGTTDMLDSNGYVCDWEHDREGQLSDFLHKLVEQSETEGMTGKNVANT